MGTEIRTATFAERQYRYVVHDVESIKRQPGVERLAGIASHPEGASHATWGTFVDEAEVRDRHWHFAPGDVVMDMGPAFGSYTLTAALQGARVYAFEPCEFCRAILQQNIDANPELADRIIVVPLGVHERRGWFEPNEGVLYDAGGGERLQVAPLDELAAFALADHERVSCVKLDVEGAELGALRSGKLLLEMSRPRLLVEEHEFKQEGIGVECEKILQGLGYGQPVRVSHGAVNHAFYESPGR